MKKLFCATMFALLTVAGSIPSAHATTLTWTLQNFVFSDGGTATGTYGYDADTNTFSAVNITTSLNQTLGLGSNYGIDTLGTSTYLDTIVAYPLAGNPRFVFSLVSAMTNAGGTIALNTLTALSLEGICVDEGCSSGFPFRILEQGSVNASPVPLPAALPLLAAGVSAMGFMGWRRKRKALA